MTCHTHERPWFTTHIVSSDMTKTDIVTYKVLRDII